MWNLIKYNLGAQRGSTVILYFPLFLSDAVHGGLALSRLDAVIADITAAGLAVLLLVGRPDYYGAGNATDSWNPILSTAARAYVLQQLAVLATPQRAATLTALSLYWLGLACQAAGAAACSEEAVGNFTRATRDAVRSASGGSLAFLQHLDGPFWDACWPQPCASWNFFGYSPASLLGSSDGLLAESWVMGSLVGGVKKLYALGVVTNQTLLLLDDTPNCDTQPSHPCATGSLEGDIAAWGAFLPQLALEGTWGVWAAVDGGAREANAYGDLLSSGTGLTRKGGLHRARALAGGRNMTSSSAAANPSGSGL